MYVNGDCRDDTPLGKLMHDFSTPNADERAAEALRIGLQQGEQKKAIENAKTMLSDELPPEKVSLYSGLPLGQVFELQKKITAKV